jgi:hypothetical protein
MILILNQFPENDPAPTSRYLKEWADDFRRNGEAIEWISGSPSYRQLPGNFLLRVIRDLGSLLGLMSRGVSVPHPDLIICSSSPPGLLIIATTLKLWHRAPLVHWAMDLHPDLTFALGEKTPLRGLFKRMMKLCYPFSDLLLTLDEGMQKHLHRSYQVDALITPLWNLYNVSPLPEVKPLDPPRWTYSGNLGKAHEWRSLLETQFELERRGSRFILRLQGNAFQRLPQNIPRPQHWELEDYAPAESLIFQLLSAPILVATQNPATTGLLWPSKLALLSVLPRPLLWIGSRESSISKSLQKRPHTGIFEPGETEKIADWIEGYKTLPPEEDFQNWIGLQPTKEAFLERVRKLILPLLPPRA